jgi:tRNA nucleotidyltransferase/poly(A) polymerase
VSPVADELGRRFAAAGHELHLVGGSVRDALLGRLGDDLDFCTDAPPEQTLEIVQGFAEAIWTTGQEFGTIGLARHGLRLEVTTYRSEAYDRVGRNPIVRYGRSLNDDLRRRDFTVNAMAVSVPGHVFVDPHGGRADLFGQVLRTPGTPQESFADDPLRMLRAARFVAQLRSRWRRQCARRWRTWPATWPVSRPSGSATSWSSSCAAQIRSLACGCWGHRPRRHLPAGAHRATVGDRRARSAQGCL